MTNEEFEKLVLSQVKSGPFKPVAIYDDEEDTLEILISDESYRIERSDGPVLVYCGRESEEITGAKVIGVKRNLASDLLNADVRFHIRDGKIKVVYLFKAMRHKSNVAKKAIFNLLISKLEKFAEENDLEANIGDLAACP